MKFGIEIPNLGEYGEARRTAELARMAEQAGWDGFFVWDHLAYVWGMPCGDPWVMLTAAACATQHIRLGALVTPLARRRVQVLAHTLATLDQLSGGRLVLGAGLGGAPQEFAAFGEDPAPRTRAARLDESLQVIDQLLRGEPVTHQGKYLTLQEVTLSPACCQKPRLPVWVGGKSRAALRRAAHWDGWVPESNDEHKITLGPGALASQVGELRALRAAQPQVPQEFDVVMSGYSGPDDWPQVAEYELAGATWWVEGIHGLRGSWDEMVERIKAGPVKI